MKDHPPPPNSTDPEPELSSRVLWSASLAGGLLLWAALPPLSWSFLAFIAPMPWLWLVAQPQTFGRGTYAIIWASMSLHWLAVLEGIRHAHPAVNLGWVALA